jgi:hypothetical protein
MKTIKKQTNKGIEYKRVDDSEADKLISSGWSFCPKTEWKVNVRDFNKAVKEETNSSENIYKNSKKSSKSNAKTPKV